MKTLSLLLLTVLVLIEACSAQNTRQRKVEDTALKSPSVVAPPSDSSKYKMPVDKQLTDTSMKMPVAKPPTNIQYK